MRDEITISDLRQRISKNEQENSRYWDLIREATATIINLRSKAVAAKAKGQAELEVDYDTVETYVINTPILYEYHKDREVTIKDVVLINPATGDPWMVKEFLD